jgi:hypothetical protein
MDRWTDRWIHGQMDRRMDVWIYRQIDAEMLLLGCSHKEVLLKKAEVTTAPLCYNCKMERPVMYE